MTTEQGSTPTVAIIGAGLAGLAAATVLAPRGFRVTLLEARQRLGGRAGSFTDPISGQLVDVCQHVSMGCCTNMAHFCRSVGIAHLLQPQPCLHFMTPDRRVSHFRAARWPAPLHLAHSFLAAHYLSFADKLRIAWGLFRLRSAACGVRSHPFRIGDWGLGIGDSSSDPQSATPDLQSPIEGDPPFHDWLIRHRQSPLAIRRFWGLVLTSALNETPERVGFRYARKVFVDAFLSHRRGFEVEIPTVPLGRLYGEELGQWFANHQVAVRLNQAVSRLELEAGRVRGLTTRQGDPLAADWYVAAVPFDRLLDLLPESVIEAEPYFGNLRHLETSPITSVHLWYDRPVLTLPHVVLVDGVGQWVFNRGEVQPGVHYVQVVVSASRSLRELGHEEVLRQVMAEMNQLFPLASAAVLLHKRVITDPAATFSVVPGVDRWRPGQASPLPNLLVAGDWTATGWPATMESAVRSGYLAAEALLERAGRPEHLLQSDLSASSER